jgi:sigma-B regulation protein RsbU (phosphoserine phosphatase)
MPGVEGQTGPPLATAAHARARTVRLFAQLRRSLLFKITLATGAVWAIAAFPLLLGQAPWPWFGAFRLIFTVALFLLLVRVVLLLAAETLWLLRNRLILAYVFMGVVPVLLIAGMLGIGAYMFYGQYAAYLLVNELNQRTRNVGAVNTLTLRELDRNPNRVGDAASLAHYYASYYFPHFGGVRTYAYDAAGKPLSRPARRFGPLGGWLKPSFRGLIATRQGYAMAGFGESKSKQPEQVLTWYVIERHMIGAMARPVGQVSIGQSGFVSFVNVGNASETGPAPVLRSTAPLPPATSVFDIKITSLAFIPVTDWTTGQQRMVIATITTRPSILNDELFATFQQSGQSPSQASRWPLVVMAVIGVGFLIIEVFSFVAGVRLTRSITGAVNDLYIGTEHVNRGQFEHRIPVRSRDQLAALEISFNNMTASIQRLLEEQRQKQRLESELNIAHEVQAQLFPRTPPQVAGLEIAGRCLPARVVSGDYFDFVQLSPTRVSLALGDISGKGISAALLMATIVAAVRAYRPSASERMVRAAAAGGGSGNHGEEPEAGPAMLLERLNQQLYHSTPPEKYATIFYADYDANTRMLRYSNAGHLPPALLGRGGVRRLDRGGMVAGLFENVQFEESVVEMAPGDLLAAWSDGITEPENEYGVEFGEARLLQILESHRARPLSEILQSVLAAVREWSGAAEQADDITLILARVGSSTPDMASVPADAF